MRLAGLVVSTTGQPKTPNQQRFARVGGGPLNQQDVGRIILLNGDMRRFEEMAAGSVAPGALVGKMAPEEARRGAEMRQRSRWTATTVPLNGDNGPAMPSIHSMFPVVRDAPDYDYDSRR